MDLLHSKLAFTTNGKIIEVLFPDFATSCPDIVLVSNHYLHYSSVFLYPHPTELEGGIQSPCPSVCPSICRWHGFQSISQVWNFKFQFHMHIDYGHRPCHFQKAVLQPYWIFWFLYSISMSMKEWPCQNWGIATLALWGQCFIKNYTN